MLETKKELTGELTLKLDLTGVLNNGKEYVQPVLQEKEVTPSKNVQVVEPDENYNGLSKVTVEPYPAPNLQSKEVIPNKQIQNITSDEEYDGLSNVQVNPIPDEYIEPTGEIRIGTSGIFDVKDYAAANVKIKEYTGHLDEEGLREIGYSEDDIAYYRDYVNWNEEDDEKFKVSDYEKSLYGVITENNFLNYLSNPQIRFLPHFEFTVNKAFTNQAPYILTMSKPAFAWSGTNSQIYFNQWYSLLRIPVFNVSGTIRQISINSYNIIDIPPYNYSQFNSVGFGNSAKLKEAKNINSSNITSANSTFSSCYSLKTIENWDTSNVTIFNSAFYNCYSLENVSELNCGKVTRIDNSFLNLPLIRNLGGFKDLGKAFQTTIAENAFTLNLSQAQLLTRESLLNVINKLYDINSMGCLPQRLIIGPNNVKKLTAEEIAIATNKGWKVS